MRDDVSEAVYQGVERAIFWALCWPVDDMEDLMVWNALGSEVHRSANQEVNAKVLTATCDDLCQLSEGL